MMKTILVLPLLGMVLATTPVWSQEKVPPSATPAPEATPASEPAKKGESVSVKVGGMLGSDAQTPKTESGAATTGIEGASGMIDLSENQQKELRDKLILLDQWLIDRKFDQAKGLLVEIEQISSSHPAVMNARGAYWAEIGEFAKAREIYRAIKDVRPDSFLATFNLVELDMMEKQYGKAREGFAEMLRKYPSGDLIYFKIFQSYFGEKNEPATVEWIRKMELLRPSSAVYYARAVVAYSTADFDGAQAQIGAALQYFPGDNHRYFQRVLSELGFLYLGGGNEKK
jgi:tetratricopeptide (TPR) repeat protein